MTNKFNLYQSNSLEKLANIFVKNLNKNKVNPLFIQEIIVQTDGVATWLKQFIAKQNDIFTSVQFTNPVKFILKIRAVFAQKSEDKNVFESSNMRWFILQEFKNNINDYSIIKEYLEPIDKDFGDNKIFALSSKIAELFDSYILYRPDILTDWSNGKYAQNKSTGEYLFTGNHRTNEIWQMLLWQRLNNYYHISGEIGESPIAILKDLKRILTNPNEDEKNRIEIWSRQEVIRIFGMTVLPPVYMEILRLISNFVTVELYLTSPSRFYWGDILTDKQVAYNKNKSVTTHKNFVYQNMGNQLLRNLGGFGKNFLNSLYSIELGQDIHEIDLFYDIKPTTILKQIQKDIINWDDNNRVEPVNLISDNSLQISRCYTPLREIEVLYDYLLDAFEKNQDLTLGDILIITPNLEHYAPIIKMIFNNNSRMNATISDRSALQSKPIYSVIKDILMISDTNFLSSDILALFVEFTKFNDSDITEQDEELLKKVITDSGIRWGIDGEFWKRNNAGEWGEYLYSWKVGIERIMLGYTLGDVNIDPLPYSDISESDMELLGKFISFLYSLFEIYEISNKYLTANEWSKTLITWFTNLFEELEYGNEDIGNNFISDISKTILSISDQIIIGAGDNLRLSFNTIRTALIETMENDLGNTFLRGDITVASMVPLRSVPFKIIAMVGMNHDLFPRKNQEMSFDLINAKKRIGDRDLRSSDLYLFLEAILATGANMYISYTAYNEKQGEINPPSSVVNQLIDYCNKNYIIDNKKASDSIIVDYPLHPFSKRYCTDDPKIFTYNKSWFTINKPINKTIENIFEIEFDEEINLVSTQNLIFYLNNPIEDLYKNIMKLSFVDEIENIEDCEPFFSNHLIDWILRDSGLKNVLLKKNINNLNHKLIELKYSAKLPAGVAFDIVKKNIECFIENFSNRLPKDIGSAEFKKYKITGTTKTGIAYELISEPIAILNNMAIMIDVGNIEYKKNTQVGKLKKLLKLWFTHLIVNSESNINTQLISLDTKLIIKNINNAKNLIEYYVDLYAESRHSFLPYFGSASYKIFHSNDNDILSILQDIIKPDYNNKTTDKFLELFVNRYNHLFTNDINTNVKELANKIFKDIEILE